MFFKKKDKKKNWKSICNEKTSTHYTSIYVQNPCILSKSSNNTK
jgi:hypothetical protein